MEGEGIKRKGNSRRGREGKIEKPDFFLTNRQFKEENYQK